MLSVTLADKEMFMSFLIVCPRSHVSLLCCINNIMILHLRTAPFILVVPALVAISITCRMSFMKLSHTIYIFFRNTFFAQLFWISIQTVHHYRFCTFPDKTIWRIYSRAYRLHVKLSLFTSYGDRKWLYSSEMTNNLSPHRRRP